MLASCVIMKLALKLNHSMPDCWMAIKKRDIATWDTTVKHKESLGYIPTYWTSQCYMLTEVWLIPVVILFSQISITFVIQSVLCTQVCFKQFCVQHLFLGDFPLTKKKKEKFFSGTTTIQKEH